MRYKIEGFEYISFQGVSHMKRFGILALALTFLMGTAATVSFAQDTPPKKEKKKKKKTPPPDDKK
jgi:hypothetical protein